MERKTGTPTTALTVGRWLKLALGAGLFFFSVCLCSPGSIRAAAALFTALTLAAAFLFWERLRDRLTSPILMLALVVLVDMVSCAYAVSGKFALNELLKVMSAFCLALLLLMLAGSDKPEREAGAVLEGFAAIAGLVSIDLLSTRWISTPVLAFLSNFTDTFEGTVGLESGVRMTSVFQTPNTFAGCIGIGILLSLGLAASSEKPGKRAAHLVCLSVSALSFVLTFSMGACIAIVPAFLTVLALTERKRRGGMLLLMAETLAVTMLAVIPIALTSMTVWTGPRPIPLLCVVCGAAALCCLDLVVGKKLSASLVRHGKAVLWLTAAMLAAAVAFVIAACALTTGVTLRAGEPLRRSIYPEPGIYTLTAEVDGDPNVVIESQARDDTVMHTYSELYRGPLSQAAFTVPEDSLVVWLTFTGEGDTRLESVTYSGEHGVGKVPLGYRLLPGFIANRLQGLWANQNAIQRFAFFADGLKMFRLSPIIGLGLGAYGNGLNMVQSFYYFTYYAHNHYIQALVETGIIGLLLFLGLLAVSTVCVWRGRKKPLAPALGATLLFLALHGAVEVTFSHYTSMPAIYSSFAVIALCCGEDFYMPDWGRKRIVRNGLAAGLCALLVLFGVLLGCNIAAYNLVSDSTNLDQLEQAAALDPFEKADYMLTYVVQVTGTEPEEEIREKADGYAQRLGKLDSNIIPYYLSEYYLDSGRTALGLEQAERYVSYVASDLIAWQKTFALLERYEQDTEEYRAAVCHIADLLNQWNDENMGSIELDEQSLAFVKRMGG